MDFGTYVTCRIECNSDVECNIDLIDQRAARVWHSDSVCSICLSSLFTALRTCYSDVSARIKDMNWEQCGYNKSNTFNSNNHHRHEQTQNRIIKWKTTNADSCPQVTHQTQSEQYRRRDIPRDESVDSGHIRQTDTQRDSQKDRDYIHASVQSRIKQNKRVCERESQR